MGQYDVGIKWQECFVYFASNVTIQIEILKHKTIIFQLLTFGAMECQLTQKAYTGFTFL